MNHETIIHSNGSKWYGEPPDTIETLIEVLGRWPLDRSSGMFREGFVTPFPFGGGARVQFFGNFRRLSHVFRIVTDDPDVIARLTAAIAANERIAYEPVDAFTRAVVKDGPLAGTYDRSYADEEWVELTPNGKRRGKHALDRTMTMATMQALADRGLVAVY